MKHILFIYLTALFLRFVAEDQAGADAVAAANVHATQLQHLFMGAVYGFPIIGAVLADRLAETSKELGAAKEELAAEDITSEIFEDDDEDRKTLIPTAD